MDSPGTAHHSFIKYKGNPIFGDSRIGTCFDVYVTKENGRYRMDFSWRPKKSLAVTFSNDGIRWEEPVITLPENEESGWEECVNRNCVLKIGGVYKMWYTGQAKGKSFIGYAESGDGLTFRRTGSKPLLVPETAFEQDSVMNPCVLFDGGVYKMWYAAGETYEPNVLCYAESEDGLSWRKSALNPIFSCDKNHVYEQDRVGGCQVLKTGDMGYVMFYIGYEDIDTARICAARSADGITGWQRCTDNPLISPDPGTWDADACYKPSVLWNEEQNAWMLWYNGRHGSPEHVGLAVREGRELF